MLVRILQWEANSQASWVPIGCAEEGGTIAVLGFKRGLML